MPNVIQSFSYSHRTSGRRHELGNTSEKHLRHNDDQFAVQIGDGREGYGVIRRNRSEAE